VATYLIHQSELTIIQGALAEYQSKHCGPGCPNASNCAGFSFCCEMERDISLGSIDRIKFYENDPLLNEAVERLTKLGQHQPRWQND
jgi:hypothetical protein